MHRWSLLLVPLVGLTAVTTFAETPPAPSASSAEHTAAPVDDAELQRALDADARERERTGAGKKGDAAPDGTGGDASTGARSGSGSTAPGAAAAFLPDIAVVADFAAAAFTSEAPLQTGGHDPTENGFTLQGLELVLGKAVDPYFRFDAVLVFAPFGVEIEEAYATTLSLPARLQLRAGQFLTRFGRINTQHLHAWNFVDQPFQWGRVWGGEGNRGLGAELSWLTPLPWFVELSGSVTDARGEGTARSFFGGDAGARVRDPLDLQSTLAAKQFFPFGDNLSLLWGLSAATGPNASGPSNRTDVFGTDLFLKYRPIDVASTTVLALQVETLYRRRQLPDALLQDWGGYAEGSWRFAPRWGTAVRYELGTAPRGGVDPLDPEWTESRHRTSASLTFWPTEFSRLRLQGAADNARWRDETDLSAFLNFEVGIGAHAAHPF